MLTKLKYLKSYYTCYETNNSVEYVKKPDNVSGTSTTVRYKFSKNVALNTINKDTVNYVGGYSNVVVSLSENRFAPLNPIPFNSFGPALIFSYEVLKPSVSYGQSALAFYYNGIQVSAAVNAFDSLGFPVGINQWNGTLSSNFTKYRIQDNNANLKNGTCGAIIISNTEGTAVVDYINSITSVGVGCFASTNYKALVLPALTTIPTSFAASNPNLLFVECPNLVTLGASVFNGCSALKVANFPLATTVGNNAFSGCTSLTTINLDSCTSLGTNVFSGITGKTLTLRISASLAANANVTTLQSNNTLTLILT